MTQFLQNKVGKILIGVGLKTEKILIYSNRTFKYPNTAVNCFKKNVFPKVV